VLVRPPAILGPGATSVWNTLRPDAMREDEADRHAAPQQTFAWVHVDDLAAFLADVATGRLAAAADVAHGPVAAGCTPVNVCTGSATVRDYYETVTGAIGVDGTATVARAARDAGGTRLVHVSTAAVYDRSPGVGDGDESSALVGDDGNDYGVTKRDADLALADVDGITRVLVRPPAILGPGESSVWNTLRPAEMRDHEAERHAAPQQTFSWVHVDDLAALIADVATGRIETADDPDRGPVEGGCTPVNACAGSATVRDYYDAVTGALGVEPVWDDRPAWTGHVLSDRARAWGWAPTVSFDTARKELEDGLQAR
jgi:nucleoside-diphosphate-sugar epimerase